MIKLLPINLLLALAWGAMTGSFSEVNLAFGFAVSAAALYLIREQVGTVGYFTRAFRIVSLAGLFIYELVLSAVRVARMVLSPQMKLNPGIVAFPLRVDRDFEITLLANLITLTPGTLSVDVSDDRRTLFVHCIDVPDPEETIREIRDGFELKIMEAFR